jgi:hypothetical protein
MRRLALAMLLVIMVTALIAAAVQPSAALPEYSAQTGEPCASCHSSPSGGGIRTPRGQAWVGEGRGGTVPALIDALALLGVKLTVNEQDFVAPPEALGGRAPFESISAEAHKLGEWLRDREGN